MPREIPEERGDGMPVIEREATTEWRILWRSGAETIGLHSRAEAEAVRLHAAGGAAHVMGTIQSRQVSEWADA